MTTQIPVNMEIAIDRLSDRYAARRTELVKAPSGQRAAASAKMVKALAMLDGALYVKNLMLDRGDFDTPEAVILDGYPVDDEDLVLSNRDNGPIDFGVTHPQQNV